VSFEDIKQFSATFWILVLICMLALGVYVPFLDDANDFYQKKFGFSSVQAGRVLMLPYLTSSTQFHT
jgi:nitrate/nitrite transporter NarK